LNAHLTKLLRRTGDMIFVTAVYVVIDAAQGRLTYAQAGHPTPLCRLKLSQRTVPLSEAAAIGGPALGLIDDFVYEAAMITLGEGDRVLCFTDGVFEAANIAGEEFGLARLATALEQAAERDLARALSAVRTAAFDFSGGRPFTDDLCLVACELGG
jgi:sigma-B regulation protein RsbU (phosphoserine phosphatase)